MPALSLLCAQRSPLAVAHPTHAQLADLFGGLSSSSTGSSASVSSSSSASLSSAIPIGGAAFAQWLARVSAGDASTALLADPSHRSPSNNLDECGPAFAGSDSASATDSSGGTANRLDVSRLDAAHARVRLRALRKQMAAIDRLAASVASAASAAAVSADSSSATVGASSSASSFFSSASASAFSSSTAFLSTASLSSSSPSPSPLLHPMGAVDTTATSALGASQSLDEAQQTKLQRRRSVQRDIDAIIARFPQLADAPPASSALAVADAASTSSSLLAADRVTGTGSDHCAQSLSSSLEVTNGGPSGSLTPQSPAAAAATPLALTRDADDVSLFLGTGGRRGKREGKQQPAVSKPPPPAATTAGNAAPLSLIPPSGPVAVTAPPPVVCNPWSKPANAEAGGASSSGSACGDCNAAPAAAGGPTKPRSVLSMMQIQVLSAVIAFASYLTFRRCSTTAPRVLTFFLSRIHVRTL